MVYELSFSGEESARFTRLAKVCLLQGEAARLTVRVSGREPLTSRPVRIVGSVIDGVLDGYTRYVVIRESLSNVEYWIAGSNATRSIAALTITFELEEWLRDTLVDLARSGTYVPGLMHSAGVEQNSWARLETNLDRRREEDLLSLLSLLEDTQDDELRREAALAVRAFARVATGKRSLQRQTERRLLTALDRDFDTETRIALVEDLGYMGTAASVQQLGNILQDLGAADHVRWAAAVAIGRLNLGLSITPLLAGTASPHAWTRAASLLGLSRRADDQVRTQLEPALGAFLMAEDLTVRRYACLALSKFSALEESTITALLDTLEALDSPMGLRGYAALAISSIISTCPPSLRDRCETILQALDLDVRAELQEPETVWGLEFLAELSTLLELHAVAEDLYAELSELFDDWRAAYYEALSLYERGESAVQGGGDELSCYRRALETLRAAEADEPDARQAIEFRTDIVDARLGLQQAIRDWENTFDPGQLELLVTHVRTLAAVFARYGTSIPADEGAKRLSERERDYLVGTRRLVEALAGIIALEATWRRGTTPEQELRAHLRNLTDVLAVVADQFRGQLAKGPLTLAELGRESAQDALDLLENDALPYADREKGLKALTNELRRLFGGSTWPMPARAYPISGLGRGELSVLSEDIPGRGTQEDPYMFPADAPAVVNLMVDIHEMAPGGATRARLVCEIAGSSQSQTIHAVEGPVRCDFILPQLSPLSSAACRFELVFEARDCTQVSARHEIFVRKREVT